ncbi:MAG: PAS domain S-box protein, partial [Candidatus Electrothrix sp. AR3]|nr:PAS domain S-box protein [Candidatus Electrothrix sp. AR3]
LNALHREQAKKNEELSRTRQELERSRQHLTHFFSYAPIGFLVLNTTGQILELNGLASKYFGLPGQVLTQRTLHSFISPESFSRYVEAVQAVVNEKEKNIETEVLIRLSATQQFWACLRMNIINNYGNESRIIFCSVRNIDREKMADQVLLNARAELIKQVEFRTSEFEISERKYRLLLNHANDAILVTRIDKGSIIEANEQASRLLHIPVRHLLRTPLNKLFAQDQVEHFFSLPVTTEQQMPSGGDMIETVILSQQNNRSIPVEVSAALIEFEGKNLLLLIIRDISERKQSEEALRQAKKRTDHANMALMSAVNKAKALAAEAKEANRAKSNFLAAMSHEIRTPMNAIIGMTDIVLQTSLTKEQQRFLNIVCNSAGCLLDLINDILDISKIEAGKCRLFPVPFLLEESMQAICDE